MTLYDLIPRDGKPGADVLLGRFLEYAEARRLQLYPAQESAILEVFEDKNVILNTPTGSGKSLVATALHFMAIAQGRRSIYTCPIKALVNEKFMALCREFGPDNVGLATAPATPRHARDPRNSGTRPSPRRARRQAHLRAKRCWRESRLCNKGSARRDSPKHRRLQARRCPGRTRGRAP